MSWKGSSRRSARGSITGSGRSTTTCRSSSSWALRSRTAAAGWAALGPATSGPGTTAARLPSTPGTPCPSPPPAAPPSPPGESALVDRLDRLSAVRYPDDPALRARIKSYELAFRMQTAVPEVLKFADEPEYLRRSYGLNREASRPFGEMCLAARRLVERGVRF